MRTAFALPGALILLTLHMPAFAGEIKLIAAGAFKPSIEAISEQLVKRGGQKLVSSFASTVDVEKTVRGGNGCDVVITGDQQLSALAKDGLVHDKKSIGHAYLAVAVKNGQPAPDVSNVEAFKTALLSAKKPAYSSGLSGVAFAKVIEKAGLAVELSPKVVVVKNGPVGDALMRGDSDFGIQQNIELLAVDGVKVIGPVPGEFGATFPSGVALCKGATEDAANFVSYLKSDEAVEIFRRHGYVQDGG